jgi:hypothetical protein
MKKIIVVLIFAPLFSFGQGVTQSAEGKSTVLLEGSAVGIDLAKTELSFGWNNLNQSVVKSNNGLLIGSVLRVKNSEGIGKLFSKGDLVPQANWSGYMGWYFSNANDIKENNYKTEKDKLLKKAGELFEDTLNIVTDVLAAEYIVNSQKRAAAVKEVKDFFTNLPATEKLFFITRFFSTAENDEEKKVFKSRLKERLVEVKKNVEIDYRKLSKERLLHISKTNQPDYYKITLFGFGGVEAMDFKRFNGFNPVNLTNSFSDVYFRGGNFGIGANAEWWRFRFGLTYSYAKTHNFSSLTVAEYKLTSSSTINNQTLNTEEKINAYSGKKYGRVEKNEFNFDIVYNCKLDKDAKNHLLINPYIRANLFSRDTSLLLNTTNVGLGGYFFKETGAFLGGIYLELPDINNNIEKKKPLDKQNFRPPLRRLTFGILAKISLKSIFNW